MSMNRVDPVTGELTLMAGRNVSTMVPSAGLQQSGTYSPSPSVAIEAKGNATVTVNLATPMPDVNYKVILQSTSAPQLIYNIRNKTTTSFDIYAYNPDDSGHGIANVEWTAVRLMTDQTTALDEAGIAAAMKYKIGESSVKANPSLPYDANSLTSVGVYSVLASITANLPVNTQEWVTVYVTQSAANPEHVQQIAIRGAENSIYSRILYNGAWGEWEQHAKCKPIYRFGSESADTFDIPLASKIPVNKAMIMQGCCMLGNHRIKAFCISVSYVGGVYLLETEYVSNGITLTLNSSTGVLTVTAQETIYGGSSYYTIQLYIDWLAQ